MFAFLLRSALASTSFFVKHLPNRVTLVTLVFGAFFVTAAGFTIPAVLWTLLALFNTVSAWTALARILIPDLEGVITSTQFV